MAGPRRAAPGGSRAVEAETLTATSRARRRDVLAVEEPLGIRIVVEHQGKSVKHDVAITMRTPGEDRELALGFLFSEGVLTDAAAVAQVRECETPRRTPGSVVEVYLVPGSEFDAERFRRNVYTSSSCGICGRAAIEQVRMLCPSLAADDLSVDADTLWGLPDQLREYQSLFEDTGGIHAAGLFDPAGNLQAVREDVGRHNAVDKLVGWLFEGGGLPAVETLLMVSGRASFELVQKAALAGIALLAAVGAPSSLAVELGEELGMTIIGFLRESRCNIYCGGRRVNGEWSG